MTGKQGPQMERRGESDTQLETERSSIRRFIHVKTLSAFHELENHDAFLYLPLIYFDDILLIATINYELS